MLLLLRILCEDAPRLFNTADQFPRPEENQELPALRLVKTCGQVEQRLTTFIQIGASNDNKS